MFDPGTLSGLKASFSATGGLYAPGPGVVLLAPAASVGLLRFPSLPNGATRYARCLPLILGPALLEGLVDLPPQWS